MCDPFSPDPIFAYPTLSRLSELPVDYVWFKLGVEFGLSQEELSVIRLRDNSDYNLIFHSQAQDSKTSMFCAAKIKIPDLKYGMLIKALYKVGRIELSREICTEKGLFIPVGMHTVVILHCFGVQLL